MASGVPEWYHDYAKFKLDMATATSAFIPFVASLPPEQVIENFTYKDGKFTLIFKDAEPYCSGKHAGHLAEEVKKAAFICNKRFSGQFSKDEKKLSLDKGAFSVNYLVTVHISSLSEGEDMGLVVKFTKLIFSKTIALSYDQTSEFQLEWRKPPSA